MKRLSLLTLKLLIAATVVAQSLPTETATHVFWQPDRKLTFEDFQGDGSAYPDGRKNCEEFNLCTEPFLGTWSVVDVPVRKLQRRGILAEKVYFAPAFEKGTSFMLNKNDTMGLKYAQLLFDLHELSARKSRQELQEYQDKSGGSTGMKPIMSGELSRMNFWKGLKIMQLPLRSVIGL